MSKQCNRANKKEEKRGKDTKNDYQSCTVYYVLMKNMND